jgi:hypothetical protein
MKKQTVLAKRFKILKAALKAILDGNKDDLSHLSEAAFYERQHDYCVEVAEKALREIEGGGE